MQASRQDPAFRDSLQIRKAAMQATIELDHSDKWTEALRFPSRKSWMCLVVTGTSSIILETYSHLKRETYTSSWTVVWTWSCHRTWMGSRSGKRFLLDQLWWKVFFLVAAVHMRHAEFEECMAHEEFIKEMKRHIKKFNRRQWNFKTLGNRNPNRPQKR